MLPFLQNHSGIREREGKKRKRERQEDRERDVNMYIVVVSLTLIKSNILVSQNKLNFYMIFGGFMEHAKIIKLLWERFNTIYEKKIIYILRER